MQNSTTAVDRSPSFRGEAAGRPPTICHRSTNTPGFVHGADGRSKLMRRRRDLIAVFVAELGGGESVRPAAMLGVIRAADATALAEEYRARALRGEPIVLDDLVRLENTASRAVKALGAIRVRHYQAPDLADYLAATSQAKID